MIRIVLLGTGNIASHLLQAFDKISTVKVVQMYGRNPQALSGFKDRVHTITDLQQLEQADMYIIAVSDDAIAHLSSELPFENRLVVHTSGSVNLTAIQAKNRRGVFYPLQTFSRERTIRFNEVPLCLEAENPEDATLLHQVASLISETVFQVNSAQRRKLHLAAVFVNNFVNHLYHIGHELCEEENIPFDMLIPLIKETAGKLDQLSPENAQTGPARRNDLGTIEKHLNLLKNEDHKTIYNVLTESIIKLYDRKKL